MFHHRPLAKPATGPRVSGDTRIYAVGDIHGCHDLLIAMLDLIARDGAMRADGRQTQVVFLGDYIDRGDDSRRVLDTLSRLKSEGGENLIILRGNHETALLDFLKDPVLGRRWLGFGAVQTLASYEVPKPVTTDPEALTSLRDRLVDAMGDHVALLEGTGLAHRSQDVVFSHAGVNPGLPLDRDDPQAMLWGHPEFLSEDPVPGQLIVHGHFDGIAPVSLPGRVCVDTGAYHTGRLTAVRLDQHMDFLTVPEVPHP